MTYQQVMEMPLRTFWSFNRQVDRLRAEQELRQLRVAAAGNSEDGKSITELSRTLREEIGSPTYVEKQFDEGKFEELRDRFNRKD